MDTNQTKVCCACSTAKPLSDFYKSKARAHLDGVGAYCRSCAKQKGAAYAREYFNNNREANKLKCRERYYASREQRLEAAKSKYHASLAEHRKKNKDNYAKHKEKRIEKSKDYYVGYYKNNKPIFRARFASYRAKRTTATPAWANAFFIKEAYDLAQLRTRLTGIPWEVDHIIPIKNKTVCGLHVESNLQVIPKAANRSKHNKYDQDDALRVKGLLI